MKQIDVMLTFSYTSFSPLYVYMRGADGVSMCGEIILFLTHCPSFIIIDNKRPKLDLSLVSVIVPIHNASKYLDECFEGLLAQTGLNNAFEMEVIHIYIYIYIYIYI